jgi:adenosylcobinamide-phosphate synthase
MNRSLLLPCAYLLDHAAGDPEWFPHPVRLIGAAISQGEGCLRRPGQSATVEVISGAGLAVAVVGSTYCLTAATIRFAGRHSSLLGSVVEVILGWTCIAARNLEQEATSVTGALGECHLPRARSQLARIVGRDTHALDVQEISRAVIEAAAESASDGIVAPLFYMALGGVPLAMAYKAVNTLDSMIGHADSRYFYFGKAAARLDDLANYLPSRISALALIATSALVPHADPHAAWQTWLRDGSKHKSPNAGQPESAMAGALRVTLGGDNTYAGERIPAQRIGAEFAPPAIEDAKRAIRLVAAASLIALGAGILLAACMRTEKRGR